MDPKTKESSVERKVRINTSRGPLTGRINFYNRRSKYYSFRMIPYANIPIGLLRFAPPMEIKSWSDYNIMTRSTKMGFGRENLLLLNIYTPEIKDPESTKTFDRPVIVFVPGDTGCSTYNTLDHYGPQFLMRQDVVLVIVGYRAGILGFVKFEDPELNAPGDVGYRDLKMAFGWIKKEIENFGGCPNNITAYGQGYGANLIRHLLMDKNNENMFHKAILSSCFEHRINNDQISSPDGVYIGRLITRHIIKMLNDKVQMDCDLESEPDCCKWLRGVDYSVLVDAHIMFTVSQQNDFITKALIQEHFDQQYPVKLPIMIGYNSREALMEEIMVDDNGELNVSMYNRYLIHSGSSEAQIKGEARCIVARRWKNFIYSLKTLHKSKIQNIPHEIVYYFNGDGMYNIGILALTSTLASSMSPNNVYFYRFAVILALKLSEHIKLPEEGVCHGYELPYIFQLPHISELTEDSPEEKTVKRMTMLWAQFARTGDPNPPKVDKELITVKWPPVGEIHDCCFNISKSLVEFGEIPHIGRMWYWEEKIGIPFLSSYKSQTNSKDKWQDRKQDVRQCGRKPGKKD